jgi:hypothetical protein
MFTVFAVIMSRGGIPFPGLAHSGGPGLAIFGCVICLFGHGPFAFNQFAIDRAGFTRQMLLPLDINDLLAGKAVGNVFIIAGQALLCWVAAGILFPATSPALWLSIPVAFVAVYFILAPLAAALSAAFPRSVNLNSIGNRSNPHPAAGLLGIASIALSAAPPALLAASVLLLGRQNLMLPVLAAWCVAAYGLHRLLSIPVRRFVASRCEDLGLTR